MFDGCGCCSCRDDEIQSLTAQLDEKNKELEKIKDCAYAEKNSNSTLGFVGLIAGQALKEVERWGLLDSDHRAGYEKGYAAGKAALQSELTALKEATRWIPISEEPVNGMS